MLFPVHTRNGLLAVAVLAALPVTARTEQSPIVVTATRVAQTADETLSSVTVITRADIERSQATSLSELLQGKAGINVATQGGAGKLTALYLRGANPGQVTVLVDGIRMGSVTTGTVAWEFLPLDQVERVEISRGPNSALYGSEAIGGVIQIFTRRGEGPFRWGASLTGGRYDTRKLSADISGNRDNSWISARVAHESTNGFDARRPTMEFGSLVDESDNDGYHNTSASLRLGHRFGAGTELEFHGLNASGNTEYDAAYPFADEDHFVQQSLGLTLTSAPTQDSDLTLTLGRSLDKRRSIRSGVPSSTALFNTERRVFSIQDDLHPSDSDTVSIGFDYHDDLVDSTTTYTETSRDTSALFAQFQKTTARQSFLGRLRPLKDEQFGYYTTGNLAWGYQLADQVGLTAAYGTAYKAPTFNDLYWPGYSNPALQPEKSDTLEAGLKGHAGSTAWELRAFHTRIRNLVVYDPATNLPGNINQARIDGLETTLSGTLSGWQTSAALTLLDPVDRTSGNILPRRAKRSLRVDCDRQYGRAGLGVTLIALGPRYDDPANTSEIGGYGLVNLRTSWQLGRRLLVQGRIDNAFDRSYQEVATYNTAGRSLFITLRYDTETGS